MAKKQNFSTVNGNIEQRTGEHKEVLGEIFVHSFVLTNFPQCNVTTFYFETVINGYETGPMLVSFICLGYTRLEAERPTGSVTPAY